MGGNVRKAVAEGRSDAIPIFLHEIPLLFSRDVLHPDIAVIHVSSEFTNITYPISIGISIGVASRRTWLLQFGN